MIIKEKTLSGLIAADNVSGVIKTMTIV